MEEWRDIDLMSDYYQVSNLGRVRSKDRTVTRIDGAVYHYTSKMIKPKKDKRGYLTVCLNFSGVKTTTRIHRLVALTFIPRKFSAEPLEVNHIDGVKTNNCVDNLEWVTSSENTIKGYETGLFENSRAKARERAKNIKEFDKSKPTQVFDKITGEIKKFKSSKEAANYYGYSDSTFREAIRVRGGLVAKRYVAQYIKQNG